MNTNISPQPRKHPDIGRTVMYDGIRCRIWGVTYSHHQCFGGIAYHLMPEGCYSLKHIIQDVPFDKLAFDPPTVAVSTGMSAQVIAFKGAV